MNTHADLERELRAVADLFADIPVAPDAWQQNQRRVAASRGRRTRSWLAAAAVLMAVALVASLVLLTGGGTNGGPPAQGGGDNDAFAPENLLGPVVRLETVTVNGEPVVHEAALSDTSGKGPSLCDRYQTSSSAAEGCASREPNADDPAVAVDWLMGTEGNGDVRGITLGVDSRVTRVRLFLDDGEEKLLSMEPGTWEDSLLSGLTLPADGPRPQFLVAYDEHHTVLQAVDLAERFGDAWLSADASCDSPRGPGQWPIPGSGGPSDIHVALGPREAWPEVRLANETPRTCIPLESGALAGQASLGDVLVVVVSPETAMVRLVSPGGTETDRKPAPSKNSPFQVAVFRGMTHAQLAGAELVALDVTVHELARKRLDFGAR